jgi:hypothetical protein
VSGEVLLPEREGVFAIEVRAKDTLGNAGSARVTVKR